MDVHWALKYVGGSSDPERLFILCNVHVNLQHFNPKRKILTVSRGTNFYREKKMKSRSNCNQLEHHAHDIGNAAIYIQRPQSINVVGEPATGQFDGKRGLCGSRRDDRPGAHRTR
jgi:hypothetical protein